MLILTVMTLKYGCNFANKQQVVAAKKSNYDFRKGVKILLL